jgi:hypothetical protein
MHAISSRNFLRTVLLIDGATCVATGCLMVGAAGFLASLTQLPASLMLYAGLSLFPIAAFIAFIATRGGLAPLGVWLIILGNAAWVAASLWLLVDASLSPNVFGVVFILGQAATVALLTALEYLGLRRLT